MMVTCEKNRHAPHLLFESGPHRTRAFWSPRVLYNDLIQLLQFADGVGGPGSGRDFFQDRVHMDDKERVRFESQLSMQGV